MTWWTWHDLNVRPRPSHSRALRSAELQVRRLAEAAGLEPAHAMRGGLANRCHTVRRRLRNLAEGTGLEPASAKCAVVFKTTALPVRLPFQEHFRYVKKQMKAAEQYREYISRHTSPEDGDARHARKATASSSAEGSLPSSRKKGTSIVKKQKERGFRPPREAARS